MLAIYPEQGQLVVAICERGKLSWAQTVPGTDAETLLGELPQLLLGAEMEGVPTNFAGIRLDRDLAPLAGPLREYFELPVEFIALDAPLPEPAGNLVPPSWQEDSRRLERGERIKQRLLLGAVLYLLARRRCLRLSRLAETRGAEDRRGSRPPPSRRLEFIGEQQRRWNELRAATDPRFFPIEVLLQAHRNLPSEQVRITDFTYTPSKWAVIGEAPSANLAMEFAEKIKAEKELEQWTITSGAPTPLKGEQARFNIEGRP